jgi:hypothetical protein
MAILTAVILEPFSSLKKLYRVSALDPQRKDRERLLRKAAKQTEGKKLNKWNKELGYENLEFPRDPFVVSVNQACASKETNHVFNPHKYKGKYDVDWHEDDGAGSNWILMIALAKHDFMGTEFALDEDCKQSLRLLANKAYLAHIDLTHRSPRDSATD